MKGTLTGPQNYLVWPMRSGRPSQMEVCVEHSGVDERTLTADDHVGTRAVPGATWLLSEATPSHP